MATSQLVAKAHPTRKPRCHDGCQCSSPASTASESSCSHPCGSPFHGQDGPLHVEDRSYTHELTDLWVESAVSAGHKRNDDFNGAEQEGAGLYQVTCRKGRRWHVGKAYLDPARQRPNLTIRTVHPAVYSAYPRLL